MISLICSTSILFIFYGFFMCSILSLFVVGINFYPMNKPGVLLVTRWSYSNIIQDIASKTWSFLQKFPGPS